MRAPTAPPTAGTWRDEAFATVALAWPMILTNLAQTAMTATDVMMMGRLGADALAAGALGSNLFFAPMIFGLGLMLATSPMLAFELGRKRHSVRDLRRTVRQGLWMATAVSVPVWLILWNTEAILNAMGQQPRLAALAGEYVRTLQWSVLPFYGYIVLRSFISALERPGWALVIVLVAVCFNAGANWALMFGNLGFPALGIPGSGLATTLSSTLMFLGLALVVALDPQFRRYRLFGRFWRADWPRFFALLRLGLPIAGLLTFEVTVFNGAAFVMGLIDANALAAHAIAIQICSLSFMVPMGLGQAATVRVGLFFGAGDVGGVRRAGWTAFALGVGFMACMGLVMLVWPQTLIGAFLDLDQPASGPVAAIAVTFLVFAALFQIVDGAQAVTAGMLRGLHDTNLPMIFAGLGYWGVGMPLGVFLAFPGGLGGSGVWIGLSAGLAVVAALLLWRWLGRGRILEQAFATHEMPLPQAA
ncbi:MAG TPA: MATE family efflux transporter [Mesorhizobium sp.]|jgi:MATE family multidrug resistance protein|nr:MATE family efflux transporter [Mesorhizobium sp.]